ncbi:MAG TPA: Ig-like domain-containing protein [Candidatus Saccharibacteria bacterium]|nr:Ig-like domain-containing protein [Candidatus Saccharibacteria bacterium]HRK94093.1 Ig-like domain-containing protein [Candidatus Saccharibacteria bacterium]
MRWLSANANSRHLYGFVISIAIGGLSVLTLVGLPVSAVNSGIGATVCGSNAAGAQIEITEPNDDSIVNQAAIKVRGTVSGASQIDVEIDGQYSSTVAVGPTQTSFEIEVTLSSGTHTITLTANDICQNQDDGDSIVITYQPETEPSDGGSTPTDVDGGITIGDNDEIAEPSAIEINQFPLAGAIISFISDFAVASGLDATVPDNNVVTGLARVGITVTALTLIVAAGSVAPVVMQVAPGVKELFNTTSARSRTYLGWILRAGGVLMMLLVYFV